MDLYFQRHDGQAVTCDDFLAAMADANGEDLSGEGAAALGASFVEVPRCGLVNVKAQEL